jgi:hypothetical protein
MRTIPLALFFVPLILKGLFLFCSVKAISLVGVALRKLLPAARERARWAECDPLVSSVFFFWKCPGIAIK